jgi:cytochrome P450
VTIFANAQIDGEPLPFMDVLAWCFIIVIAGNETTRNGTTGGMLAFIEHQDQLRRLQADPSLLVPAVEEVVRWTSPIIHFGRTATKDVEIRGKKIKKGDALALFYPSANRDEEIFEDPFTLPDRPPARTRTSASASASTSASARTWRGSRCRWPTSTSAADRRDRARGSGVAAALRPGRRREAPADPVQDQAHLIS